MSNSESRPVLAIGDKLHIMTRRLFEDDVRRHFLGEVTAISNFLAEVTGYTFIFHTGMNEYRRLPELRVRIFSVGESGYTVNKLPADLVIDSVEYGLQDGRLVLTNKSGFSLSINEFGYDR